MGCTCTSSALLLSNSSLFTCQPRPSLTHRSFKLRTEAQDFTLKAKFNELQLTPTLDVLKSRHALPSLVIGYTLDSGNFGSNNNNNNNNNNGGRNNDGGGDNDNHRKSPLEWASLSRQLLLCLLLVLGSFGILHLNYENAFGISLDKEGETTREEVWEIKGSMWSKLIPHPSEDEFVVVPSSSSTMGEVHVGDLNSFVSLHSLWLVCKDLVIQLMLPEGFPNSVTSDYLDYSLWRGVQGIASQISGVLATQSLLYAVGLGKGAIPTAAAINWVLKDGIGYLSKIVLSKYGRHFDVHPKGWRLFADLLENAAFGLEIVTPAVPHLFVVIGTAAGAGRSAAALIQAATRSCFYAGFAAKRNFAEVIAKGEAQGMVSKSVGIMLGIALANAIGSSTPLSIACFSVITCIHMFCNLKSYQSIQLRTLNPYRASLVYSEYLLSGQIPSVKEVNDEEPLFPVIPLLNLRPTQAADSSILSVEAKNAAAEIEKRMELGSPLSNLIQRKEDAIALFDLYRDERYILTEYNGKFCVVLKEGASPQDMLRSLYQVNFLYWLETNAGIRSKCASDDCKPGGKLQFSLEYVQREFDHVKQDSELAGWVSDGLIARPLPHRIHIENVSLRTDEN